MISEEEVSFAEPNDSYHCLRLLVTLGLSKSWELSPV